ncbi:TonB-dependent siderophore receptor [Candidimonas sp. SYP-B2681]|uniref:TonB-dependent receptor n=1 Tax=Candidimonas sp. SYP-B2681 TaxID=2497686 RepID=UPI0013154E6B|nr:TonB-dependent siderophore receptor [Candidimonas sp. SYP-B2681]
MSQLTPVKVQGSAPAFKPEAVQSVKFKAPLLDTPQTINIVPSEVLKQQSAQSLQDVLSNVPGITFSSGEGNAGWGDMFTIRGFSAEQSVTVDGVRDSALTSRNDMFNVEQVEVYKGTGSIESGVASIGGSVNLVSKTPKLDKFYDFNVGIGTDSYRRTTADLNQQIGETSAFRLNAMYHENDVAGRGPTNMDRWGIAPSFSWGLGTPTRITASYFYQKDKNTPDFGLPLDRNGKRMQHIDKDFWGGLDNADIEETESNSATLRVEHDFNSKTSIRNQTRWSETKRFTYLTTGGRLLNVPANSQPGAIVATGNSNYWGYNATGSETYPSGFLAAPRLNNANSYKGTIVANQTDLDLDFNTGNVRHQMVTGVEFYEESYRKEPFSHNLPSFTGKRVIDVRNPDTNYQGRWARTSSTDESGAKVTNVGLYAYDQITLNQNWEIAAGLRYDNYNVKWYGANGSPLADEQNEGIWSGRLGVVYKPVDYGSIYLSYSEASQPSAAAAASRSGGGSTTADYSPGKARTWELGSKWDLLDEKLSLTGAIFQIERSNPTDTDEFNVVTQTSAKERVRGFEFGLAGNITPKLSTYGGFTVMDSKVLENSEEPWQEGGKMKNVPNVTFNTWTNYTFNSQWDAGVGAQYIGKRRFVAGNTVSGAGGHTADVYMPSFWLFNAAVGYKINKNLSLRLNVNNIFDEFYISRGTASSDGFQLYGVPGAGRTLILNAEARF